jgi:glycosyltransferase involved in cell wall biosynthesis
MLKKTLSVSIVSFNEEENIGRTLKSIVDIADEIVVVDSNSTDKTREIALSYGAKVFIEDWKGYINQKNSALEKCKGDWILCLDCDEVVTKELKEEIVTAVGVSGIDGYFINRRTVYLNKELKYVWQPDWKLRLVRRSASPRWTGYDPHDSLSIDGQTRRLKGILLHYPYKNVNHHFMKLIKYARTAALSYKEMNKSFKFYHLIFNPVFAFLKQYFLKRGFLDGFRGLIVAFSSFFYVFLKYLFLWEEENKEEKKSNERSKL